MQMLHVLTVFQYQCCMHLPSVRRGVAKTPAASLQLLHALDVSIDVKVTARNIYNIMHVLALAVMFQEPAVLLMHMWHILATCHYRCYMHCRFSA